MPDRPNVIVVMTDQQRGDAIGADPECPTDDADFPLVRTPNVDNLVEAGALFARAYSPAPTSVPARRCLWTGQTPATNGCAIDSGGEWDFANTLPGTLNDAGYQTWLVGKTHTEPPRNHFGFEGLETHTGLRGVEEAGLDHYANWLEREGDGQYTEESSGLGRNSWDARPWHLAEHEHPTNWTTNRALEFLETKRDPTRPFFLTVSYVRPHQPYDPPQAYWDRYAQRDLPEPTVGEWASDWVGQDLPTYPSTNAWQAELPAETVNRARIGYYGSVSHVDHQLKRLLRAFGEWENTLLIFVSDHGDMLGDHDFWRKGFAFEGSARVPLVMRFPRRVDVEREQVVRKPVGLEDLMPTVLDVTGVDAPDTVEGRSVLPLLDGSEPNWRDRYHGELGPHYAPDHAMQYLVDADRKYVWNPVTDRELLFDLETDPLESQNLAADPSYRDELETWRTALIDRLDGRPEGFTDGEALRPRRPDDWETS